MTSPTIPWCLRRTIVRLQWNNEKNKYLIAQHTTMLQYLDSREINNNKEVEPLKKKNHFSMLPLSCTVLHVTTPTTLFRLSNPIKNPKQESTQQIYSQFPFSNRSQMMSKCGKNKKVAHKAQSGVSLIFFPHFSIIKKLKCYQ